MKNYIYLFFFSGFILLTFSCDDFDELENSLETERELAVPLFHTTTTLVDLLDGFNEETFVTMGPADLITLNYKGDVTKRTATELFSFIQLPPIPLLDSVSSFPFDLPGTLDVTLMRIKSGTIGLQVTNEDFDEDVDVTVTIPQLRKNGNEYSKQRLMGPSSSNNNEWIDIAPNNLAGYELDGGDDSLKIYYNAIRQSDGERVTFTDNLPIILITGLEFQYIEGFWGTEPLDLARDTIEIEFFENWVQGDVYFEDPSIEINVENSFGFPVRSQVNLLDILTVNEDVISLQSQYITDGIDFDYPALNELGVSKTTIFDFTKENSNVVEVLSSGPVSVDYDIDAISNPDGIQEIGFMLDTSAFKVQVTVELPFRGRVNNFKAKDVFNVNFDSYNNVRYIEFKMVADNEIPLGIDIQLYFADENSNIIDSLYTNETNILAAAPVDEFGDITGMPTETTTFATIDAAKFERIKDAKKLIVEGAFFTTEAGASNAPIVNLKADQEVNIRMGMKVGTK